MIIKVFLLGGKSHFLFEHESDLVYLPSKERVIHPNSSEMIIFLVNI